MDIIDEGNRIAERYLSEAIAAILSQPKETQRVKDGKVLCVDCGEEIPAARLRLVPHCIRCVDCQEDFEEEARRH